MPSFSDLGVPARLVTALDAAGLHSPFPIQQATLPDALAGRDVLGRGRTGSGKTLAFALPIVTRLAGDLAGGRRRAGHPLALVLAPTRELATQIAAVVEPLATTSGLTVTTIFGGVSQQRQVQALRAGVDIVVGCPGRLEDLIGQRELSLDAIEITVLDEADHMADMGFLPGVTRILGRTPEGGQRLLFSATLDNGVDALVRRFLHAPVTHSVDDETSHVDTMAHAVFAVADADAKRRVLEELAAGSDRRILFVRTKHVAKKLAKQLVAAGIAAADLQGNLSQNARDRNLAAFSEGEIRVLVATDVAARGVHVDDVSLVVHVDPPTEHKAYLHRSGRTARAGASGTVVTLVLPEQRRDVAALLKKAGIAATPQAVEATDTAVQRLVGERAPKFTPPPAQVAPPRAPRAKAAAQVGSRRSASSAAGSRRGSGAQTNAAGARRGQGAAASAAGTRRGQGGAASAAASRRGQTSARTERTSGGSRAVWSSDGGGGAARFSAGTDGGRGRSRGGRRS